MSFFELDLPSIKPLYKPITLLVIRAYIAQRNAQVGRRPQAAYSPPAEAYFASVVNGGFPVLEAMSVVSPTVVVAF